MLTKGSRIPDIVLHRLSHQGHVTETIPALSAGKRVIVVAVPGAFTPTCSKSHLPMFLTRAYEFERLGIDRIICLSTADFYVMDAWGKDRHVGDRIMMLSDGDAEFARSTGMTADFTGHGFGIRSKRYVMVVKDGLVETILVETDPLSAKESSADALLGVLSSEAA